MFDSCQVGCLKLQFLGKKMTEFCFLGQKSVESVLLMGAEMTGISKKKKSNRKFLGNIPSPAFYFRESILGIELTAFSPCAIWQMAI